MENNGNHGGGEKPTSQKRKREEDDSSSNKQIKMEETGVILTMTDSNVSTENKLENETSNRYIEEYTNEEKTQKEGGKTNSQNTEQTKKQSNPIRKLEYENVTPTEYDPSNMSTYEKHLALRTADGELFLWPNGSIKLINYLEKGGYHLNHRDEIKRIKEFTNIHALKEFITENKVKFNNVIETTFNAGVTADYFLANSEDVRSFVVSFDRMLNKYSYLSKLYIDINYHIQHLLVVGDTSNSIPQYSSHFPHDFHFNLIFIDLTNPDVSFYKVQNDLMNLKPLCSSDALILFDHSVHNDHEYSFTLAKYSSPTSSNTSSNDPQSLSSYNGIIDNLVSHHEIEVIATSNKGNYQPIAKDSEDSSNDNKTAMILKDRYGQGVISNPNPPLLEHNYKTNGKKTTIDDFLLSAKYHLKNDIEGHSKEDHFKKFHILFDNNPQIRTITEIGFNAGHSCQFFLEKLLLHAKKNNLDDSTIEMVSFDIILHDYCFYSKVYIDKQFPKRHLLVAGDSNEAVQMYHSVNPEKKFDLLFIDGDHTFDKALLDIKNMQRLAHKDSILIIDNIAPHRGVGIQVYEAMERAIEEKIFLFHEHEEVGDYADGFAVGKYYFGDEDEYEKSLQTFKREISHMKRRIAICEVNKIIDNINQQRNNYRNISDTTKDDLDVWIICFNAFLQLKQKGANNSNNNNNHHLNNRDRNREHVDNWAMNSISRTRLKISQQLLNRLDGLYLKLKDISIRDRRAPVRVIEQNIHDLKPYLSEYQKLSCGIIEAITENTGGDLDGEYFNKQYRRLRRAWDLIEDVVDDIFYFLEGYLSDIDENLRKMILDLQSIKPKKEKVRECIRNWLNGMEHITSDQLSTKTSTLKDSSEFKNILNVLNA